MVHRNRFISESVHRVTWTMSKCMPGIVLLWSIIYISIPFASVLTGIQLMNCLHTADAHLSILTATTRRLRRDEMIKKKSFDGFRWFAFASLLTIASKNESRDGWHMTLCLQHIPTISRFGFSAGQTTTSKNWNHSPLQLQNNKAINSYRRLAGCPSPSLIHCGLYPFYCAIRAWM